MQYTWTPEDIICGRIVCKQPVNGHFRPDGSSAKWTFKIGFTTSSSDGVSLLAMTDGMVCQPRSKEDMAKHLNDQGMIPMPHSWLIQTMDFLRDSYER